MTRGWWSASSPRSTSRSPAWNLQRAAIWRTVNGFIATVRPGDEVVVFYAGHGVQVAGVNYLPAVDADIRSEEDVPLNSLNLNTLLDRLDEAKAGIKLVFLDACRNNPYARSFRSGTRGLARMGAAPSGTLLHFATRPGSVAADGDGTNGLYTQELARQLDAPRLPVEQMLKRVAAAVENASKGQQEPWAEGSIKGDFYFNPEGDLQLANVEVEPNDGGLGESIVGSMVRLGPGCFMMGSPNSEKGRSDDERQALEFYNDLAHAAPPLAT